MEIVRVLFFFEHDSDITTIKTLNAPKRFTAFAAIDFGTFQTILLREETNKNSVIIRRR